MTNKNHNSHLEDGFVEDAGLLEVVLEDLFSLGVLVSILIASTVLGLVTAVLLLSTSDLNADQRESILSASLLSFNSF